MEEQKALVPMDATRSIADIESSMPPLRGEGASLFSYYQELETMQQQLDAFYNGNNNRLKKHKWDAQRAKNSEFIAITNRILKLVGGSIGCRMKEEQKVVMAVGLGQFSSSSRLSSLHEAFMAFFMQKARFSWANNIVVAYTNTFWATWWTGSQSGVRVRVRGSAWE
ncbi:hypothetical protein EDD21DRAFT_238117 [Dissophora ornata]|nr:hypothetical protein EDD21DRAFT_238117 [Dissophora ornata]